VDAHLRYLEPDVVTRDGEQGQAYSAFENEADGKVFIERGREDRHEFRFIVAPEDATEMADLRGFARDLMRQMESDWPPASTGSRSTITTPALPTPTSSSPAYSVTAGSQYRWDYIAHGVRHRASELVTRKFGHQSESEL